MLLLHGVMATGEMFDPLPCPCCCDRPVGEAYRLPQTPRPPPPSIRSKRIPRDTIDAHKVDFYTRQFVDAISPSNFLATNPEVLQTTIETGGENMLLRGLTNLLDDLERGPGQLAVTMTDLKAISARREYSCNTREGYLSK